MQSRSPDELLQAAERAIAARDAAAALGLLAQAESVAGPSERLNMLRAIAFRTAGNLVAAIAAFDDILDAQPYNFMALLSKGTILEQMGNRDDAVDVYRNVIKIAPPDDHLPPPAVRQLAAARNLVAATSAELQANLLDAVADIRRDLGDGDLRRFDEALGIFAGVRKPFVHEPLFFHYPQLPAIPFYDRQLFPWLEELEGATDTIVSEMLPALANASASELAPYIQYPKGVPVNQWVDLNHSTDWTSYFLWKDGDLQVRAKEQNPETFAVLDRLPLCDLPGYSPTVVFSVLQARTHIPPHTGSTNVRLLAHLPLLLPGPARFRVGNETRAWRIGEAWAFDDSIEHEAWNDADQQRVILILDVWNPLLSEAERLLVSRMLQAFKTLRSGKVAPLS